MKKQTGFTLIELLAIIIILAILAVITIPIVINIIEKSRKGASYDSAYGIVDTAKKSFFKFENEELTTESLQCSFPNNCSDLKYDGKEPTSGKIRVNSDGNINGEVTFYDKYTYCIYNNEVINGSCGETIEKDLKDKIKETDKTHIYKEDGTLDKDKIYNCIEFDINVGEEVPFCVMGETNDTVTLITKNTIGLKQWANNGDTVNTHGPVGVLSKILEQTSGWNNLEIVTSYTYDDNNQNGGNYGYNDLSITNGIASITEKDGETITTIGDETNKLRARAITKEEVEEIIDGEYVPEWLKNTWTITSDRRYQSMAWLVDDDKLSLPATMTSQVIHDSNGIRAVITIPKSAL
jgi:competence protein ComGC